MLYEFFEVEFNVLDGFEPKKQWPMAVFSGRKCVVNFFMKHHVKGVIKQQDII